MRTTGPDGFEIIKHFETCRLKSYIVRYKNPRTGEWVTENQCTNGWGEAFPLSKHPFTMTQEQADADLLRMVGERDILLNNLLGPRCMSVILPYQYDATSSFFYNALPKPFETSHFLALMRNCQFHAASAEFLKWDHGDHGVELLGLKYRRESEQFLFDGGSIVELRNKHFFQI